KVQTESVVASSLELGILVDHRLHDGQLADEINEAVEFPRIYLDRRRTRTVNPESARRWLWPMSLMIAAGTGRGRPVIAAYRVVEALDGGNECPARLAEIGGRSAGQTS